jgi:hypothetical protein
MSSGRMVSCARRWRLGVLVGGAALFVAVLWAEPPDPLQTFVMRGQTYVIPRNYVERLSKNDDGTAAVISLRAVLSDFSGLTKETIRCAISYRDPCSAKIVRAASMHVGLPNIDAWVPTGAALMSDAEDSNSILQKAFTSAMKQTEDLRKRDRSTYLDCTRFFVEFNRYQETEPYIKFFNSIGVPTFLDDRNQRHYVYFEFKHTQLRSMGLSGFLRGDRVVIVFTTANASSSQVTSFKVSLLNDNYL